MVILLGNEVLVLCLLYYSICWGLTIQFFPDPIQVLNKHSWADTQLQCSLEAEFKLLIPKQLCFTDKLHGGGTSKLFIDAMIFKNYAYKANSWIH